MSSQTLFDPLNWAASLLMTMNGIFGIVCNGIIVHSFVSSPLERTSFNLICAYRAVLNCVILSWGFIGTFVPLAIFGDTLFPPVYHLIVITCVNSLYVGLQYCGFLVAINRFCAMYFPIMYSTLFSLKLTIVFTFAIFCYRISRIVVELLQSIPKECFSVYSSVDLNWSPYLNPECREKYANVVDATAILLVVLILLNIATFVKIYLFYKSTELGSRDIKEKMKRNKIMFTQTILQDLTYLIDMLFTFKLGGIFTSRVWTFISGSFIWESVHSFDGLIMIMFNERLTFLKRSFFSSTANPSAAIQMTKTVPSRSYPAPID